MPIPKREPKALMARRQLLSLGATIAATTACAGPATAKVRQPRDRPWIPSKEFLADLPRLMEFVSLPGLAMATGSSRHKRSAYRTWRPSLQCGRIPSSKLPR